MSEPTIDAEIYAALDASSTSYWLRDAQTLAKWLARRCDAAIGTARE